MAENVKRTNLDDPNEPDYLGFYACYDEQRQMDELDRKNVEEQPQLGDVDGQV